MASASLFLGIGGVFANLFSPPLESNRRVAMVLIPLPDGIWEGGHDLCPSPPENRRSVVVVTPIPLLERRREGGYGLCPSLFLGSGGVFASPWKGVGQV